MALQLYNPESKKMVNVSAAQIKTLKKAGWKDSAPKPKEEPKKEVKK